MPRKKKTDAAPDEADLQDDNLEATEDTNAAMTLEAAEEEYVEVSDDEAEGIPPEAVNGIEIQLGVLTARIEELTGIVRRLEKKLEKTGEGRSESRPRDNSEGFRPRGGGFNRDSGGDRPPRRDFGGDRPRFDRDSRGGGDRDSRPGGFGGGGGGFNRDSRPGGFGGGGGFNRDNRGGDRDSRGGGERSGGFNRDSRPGGFNRDSRPGGGDRDSRPGGFNRDSRPGGFGGGGGFNRDSRPSGESRGFGRSDARGGDTRPTESRPTESRGGGDDSRGFGRRKDHGFGKRREE
jgi:hypothetical protein